ncbi:MAG TPA: copper amine oxidase N-terminal domain-containing protein [Candidatus Fimicola cottocaccae]|nr:copper amine oxidase N-terminal domain-containing protein [Candidatus Fimicola cottocaccae]
MKKFISLALAAAMTLSLVPVSAFASTDNRISNVVTVEKDDVLKNAPQVVIMNDKGDIKAEKFSFELVLDGAEWDDVNKVEIYEADTRDFITNVTAGFVQTGEEPASGDSAASATSDLTKVYAGSAGTATGYLATVEKLSSTRALVTIDAKGKAVQDGGLKITLNGAKITGDKATVTVDPRQSTVSADTFTFAKSVDGGTVATIDDTTDFTGITEIKPILLEEVTAGTIDDNDEITLKLNSGFKFTNAGTVSVISGDLDLGSKTYEIVSDDNRTIKLKLGSDVTESKKASILKFEGIKIDEDGASEGKVAEITVNGTNVDKTTLEVGTYVDYNVSVSAEDKDLPTIYSGVAVDDDNNETLKLTVKEGVSDSWFLESRKTTFTFPEGVKVKAVNVDSDTDKIADESSLEGKFTIDGNEVTFSGAKKTASTDKAKLVVSFDVIIAPDFTGDIKCTVGGAAVAEDTEVTLAKAVAPVTVEAEKTSVAIDYRNVAVGDITIKEAEAGLWGKNQTIVLQAENMSFESGMKAEVVEGDGEIKKLDVNGGKITITVDSESSKTPMTIKLTDASLYLDRTLPAGDYALNLVAKDKATDVMFETYNKEDGDDPSKDTFGFDVDEVEVLKDYVTVATAGRDQGTTFTTNVVVTIDSTTMLVDGKEVTLDVPAYLSAEGWTMLPVRAVTESLASASNSEPVDWIAGNPGTIMIYYGDKTVSMTLGSTTMYINGTPVPMSTAPVIVNDRAFLPMRDLGRALGLSDSQIAWDATARTATFNPTTTAAE